MQNEERPSCYFIKLWIGLGAELLMTLSGNRISFLGFVRKRADGKLYSSELDPLLKLLNSGYSMQKYC